MTKNIISLSALFFSLCLPLSAQKIGRNAAARIAAQYLDKVTMPAKTRGEVTDSAQNYYIFNDEDTHGFVIVAGDSRMNEVVGYSATEQIDTQEMPLGLRNYLNDYEQYVQTLPETVSWATPRSTSYAPVASILKSKWSQNTPYNDLAPRLGGTGARPPIGCVATATAQIMFHHKWPAQGKGQVTYTPAYKNGLYGEQSVDFEKSVYEWNKMEPLSITTVARQAVAKLMYDVSVAERMDFSPKGSSTYIESAAQALTNNFDYTCSIVKRDNVGTEEFLNLLRDELSKGYPVILRGTSSGGGHAWVCDGFDENGLFSMNWGWGGMSNGYFDMSYLEPAVKGTGGGSGGGYHRNQSFVRIRPNKGGEKPFAADRVGFDFGSSGYIEILKESATAKEGLKLSLKRFGNLSSATPLKTKIALGLYADPDAAPVKTYQLDTPIDENMAYQQGTTLMNLVFSPTFEDVADGVYNLYPMANAYEIEDKWYKTTRPSYIKIALNAGKLTILERNDKPQLHLLSAIEGNTTQLGGRSSNYRLHIGNTSNFYFTGNLKVVLKSDTQEYTQDLNSYCRFLDNASEYRKVTITFPDTLKNGYYKMSFVLDGTYEGHLKTEIPVEPFVTDFIVKIQNTKNEPVLNYVGTVIGVGNVSLGGEPVDVSEHSSVQLITNLTNVGNADYNGELRYTLQNIETGETIELDKVDYAIKGNSIEAAKNSSVTVDFYKNKLSLGSTYRIKVDAYAGGSQTDSFTSPYTLQFTRSTGISEVNESTSSTAITYRQSSKSLEVATAKQALLSVYTMGGAVALSRQQLSEGTHTIDVSNLPAGVYIVVVDNGTKRVAKTIKL